MTQLPALPFPVRDLGLLLARLGVGIAFAVHGGQKLDMGLDAVSGGMASSGVPFPRASALFATSVELGGGALLALGAATALAGVLLAVLMTGAFAFVHAGNGALVKDGGWELVVALGATCLFIAAAGAGRFSVDHLVTRLRGGGREDVEVDATGPDLDVDVDVDVRQERSALRDSARD